MADSGNTVLFVSLVVFYTLIVVFSNVFDVVIVNDVSYTREELRSMSFGERQKAFYEEGVKWLFGHLDDMPVVQYFTPVLKIMSFGFIDQVPALVSILLNMVNVFTAFIVLDQFRGFL